MSENHELGEIIRGREIGRGTAYSKFMWVRCPDCYEERWAQYTASHCETLRVCKDCSVGRAKQNFYIGTGIEHKPIYKNKVE